MLWKWLVTLMDPVPVVFGMAPRQTSNRHPGAESMASKPTPDKLAASNPVQLREHRFDSERPMQSKRPSELSQEED